MRERSIVATLLVLLFGVCAASAGEVEEWMAASAKAWEDAFNAGDAKAVAALYAVDAVVLPPFSEPVEGREAIEQLWAEMIADAGGCKLKVKEGVVSGDLAYELGMYKVLDVDGQVTDQGKYMVIWKQTDEGWRLFRDIWNSSLPESSAEPE